jgi:hypothetical protein
MRRAANAARIAVGIRHSNFRIGGLSDVSESYLHAGRPGWAEIDGAKEPKPPRSDSRRTLPAGILLWKGHGIRASFDRRRMSVCEGAKR